MSSLRRAGLLFHISLTAVFALSAGSASAANLYVATSGSNVANDCSNAASPCQTIKYAITQAEGTVEADTINVGAGTYAETIPLNKSGDAGMTIVGAGSDASKGTTIAGGAGAETLVIVESLGAGATLSHLRLTTSPTNSAFAIFGGAALSATDVAIEMGDGSSVNPAVRLESGLLEHVSVGGVWSGGALEDRGSVTIRDSSFVTSAAATGQTALIVGMPGSNTAIVQRSIFKQANHSGTMPTYGLLVSQTNLTLDSSMVLGGQSAMAVIASQSSTTTIDGSTIDAAQPGISDPPPDRAIHLEAGENTTVATVAVEGSILAESQFSSIFSGTAQATITCSNSDVPSQTQLAKGAEGAINCANGASGNTTTSPFSALFADPSGTFSNPLADYQLSPSSTAVDSVPAGTISIPTTVPSATDLAGNARVVDGNGDCAALQDKGALELQGHACPPPVEKQPPPPVAGSITNLSIAPNAFFAAPSGATISKKKKAKKSYGTTISYKDSQAATTTFTVLKPSSGRTQGKACKKPSKANKHGKHCTIYAAVGSFTHADVAGANKLHFSGRLKGRKLGKGSYRLQAVPHNAAGNGKAVSKEFKIK